MKTDKIYHFKFINKNLKGPARPIISFINLFNNLLNKNNLSISTYSFIQLFDNKNCLGQIRPILSYNNLSKNNSSNNSYNNLLDNFFNKKWASEKTD